MKHARSGASKSVHRADPVHDRRADQRLPFDVRLMYSAQDEHGALIMGDGSVIDISNQGLQIIGDSAVTRSLALTLFVYLPDGHDPLFVMNARVAWSTGHRFGVRFMEMNVRERNRLRYFLCSRLQRSKR
jgi:hypothetical protein